MMDENENEDGVLSCVAPRCGRRCCSAEEETRRSRREEYMYG